MTNERKHSSPAQHLAQLGDRMGGPDMKRSPIKEQAAELRNIIRVSNFTIVMIDGDLFGLGPMQGESLKSADVTESVDDILAEAIRIARESLSMLRSIRNGIDGCGESDEMEDFR